MRIITPLSVIFILAIMLIFNACETSISKPKKTIETQKEVYTYRYAKDPTQNISLIGNLHSLELNILNESKTPTLFVLSDLEDPLFKDYIPALNSLKSTFKERLNIVVLLKNPYLTNELEAFLKRFKISFMLLNPTSPSYYKTFLKQNKSLEKTPSMLLYNSKHKLINIYQGVVPAEMLSFDISNLLKG
ncbi:hypothetical protein [Helicobacter cetorum]|uniref:Uncharacterized protein n=1 Tax=Helicobacter cetorum (strain ATCC BAA-429 / MIT 00-7128) TaxID=182217 RepID=I0EMN2_HELC0|nr:hypothetical protein [Helicobacter cetorum]AFI04201.1 hypothetical protein HCW_04670 [Helicobacter cetorum MIT 00-7128]